MSPKVKRRFHGIIRRSGIRPERALEVGGLMGEDSLLRFPELAGAERYCLNLVELPSDEEITAVTGNANDMSAFKKESFDLVVCCSTLEHDKRFWLSVAEMKRVMRPGGLLVIGVPGYVKDAERDQGRSTLTYRVHYKFDYYRFSEQAVREVFFDGLERVRVRAMMTPPRLIGHGWKPRRPGYRRGGASAIRARLIRARAWARRRAVSTETAFQTPLTRCARPASSSLRSVSRMSRSGMSNSPSRSFTESPRAPWRDRRRRSGAGAAGRSERRSRLVVPLRGPFWGRRPSRSNPATAARPSDDTTPGPYSQPRRRNSASSTPSTTTRKPSTT